MCHYRRKQKEVSGSGSGKKIKAFNVSNKWRFSLYSLNKYTHFKKGTAYSFSQVDNNIALKSYLILCKRTNLEGEDRVFRNIACCSFQLYGQQIEKISFFNSIFSDVNFQGTNFVGVKFANCEFHDVFFSRSAFIKCKFDRCLFFGARFFSGSVQIVDGDNISYTISSIMPSYNETKTRFSTFYRCRFYHTDCRRLLGVREMEFLDCTYDKDSYEQERRLRFI